MNFLIDENVPYLLVDEIVKRYPDSESVYRSGLRGSTDEQLYEYANIKKLVILTMDIDFGDVIKFPLERTEGRIVIRLKGLLIKDIVEKVLESIELVIGTIKHMREKLVILNNTKIRIKGLEE